MANKVGILFTGINQDIYLIGKLRDLVYDRASDIIEVHQKEGAEKMQIDVTEFTSETDLEEEAGFIIETAKNIIAYEKDRDKTIKQMGNKIKQKLRKNIN